MAAAEREARRGAQAFIDRLVVWLNTGQYEGTVVRKQGVPLDARITEATSGTVTIDLGFGPNLVPIRDLSPAWLLEVGKRALEEQGKAQPGSDPEAWAEMAWFARVMGERETGEQIASQLASFSEDFGGQWKLCQRIHLELQTD